MPIPHWITRVNRAVTNRLMLRISSRVPPLATIQHVGRRSGRAYRTPVLAFRTGRGVVVALTYGPDVDWLRNVLAAGSFDLARGGRSYRVGDLRRTSGPPGLALVPAWTRVILRLLRVDAFLEGSLHPVHAGGTAAAAPGPTP